MAAAEVRIGSLCSGVGGLDLGVQAALGGDIAWHAETDPRAARVLARHWPHTPNLGDVQAIDWHRAEPVCIVTAGFPCQDLSVAGPRTGLAPGTRSGVWRHIVHAIDALNPCLVVIENVRGLLSTRAGTHALRDMEPCTRCMGDASGQPRMRALGVLLADLVDLGYDANWTCVRAAHVGAPHRRERVFLVAWPQTPGRRTALEDTDSEPRQQRRLPAPQQAESRGPRPHPGRRDRALAAHSLRQRRCQGLAEPEARQRQPHPGLYRGNARCAYRGHRSSGRTDLHGPEEQCRHEPTTGGHSPDHWWGEFLPAIRRWERVTERAAPMPTVHGMRRLSADFVEWMMGLPDGWVTGTEGLSRAAQLRLLGNSVVPRQAAQAVAALISEDIRFRASPAGCGTGDGCEP